MLNQNQIRDHQKKEIQMEIMDQKKNHKVNHLIMVDHKAKESHRVPKNLIVKEKLLKIINPWQRLKVYQKIKEIHLVKKNLQ